MGQNILIDMQSDGTLHYSYRNSRTLNKCLNYYLNDSQQEAKFSWNFELIFTRDKQFVKFNDPVNS